MAVMSSNQRFMAVLQQLIDHHSNALIFLSEELERLKSEEEEEAAQRMPTSSSPCVSTFEENALPDDWWVGGDIYCPSTPVRSNRPSTTTSSDNESDSGYCSGYKSHYDGDVSDNGVNTEPPNSGTFTSLPEEEAAGLAVQPDSEEDRGWKFSGEYRPELLHPDRTVAGYMEMAKNTPIRRDSIEHRQWKVSGEWQPSKRRQNTFERRQQQQQQRAAAIAASSEAATLEESSVNPDLETLAKEWKEVEGGEDCQCIVCFGESKQAQKLASESPQSPVQTPISTPRVPNGSPAPSVFERSSSWNASDSTPRKRVGRFSLQRSSSRLQQPSTATSTTFSVNTPQTPRTPVRPNNQGKKWKAPGAKKSAGGQRSRKSDRRPPIPVVDRPARSTKTPAPQKDWKYSSDWRKPQNPVVWGFEQPQSSAETQTSEPSSRYGKDRPASGWIF